MYFAPHTLKPSYGLGFKGPQMWFKGLIGFADISISTSVIKT